MIDKSDGLTLVIIAMEGLSTRLDNLREYARGKQVDDQVVTEIEEVRIRMYELTSAAKGLR